MENRFSTLAVQTDPQTVADLIQLWGSKVLLFSLTVVVIYVLGRLVVGRTAVRIVRLRNPNNPTLIDAVILYLDVALLVIAVPVAVTIIGFGNYLTGSAILVAAVTLAVGVAGQDVISNLVSGVFLVLDPNFNVADYVEWDDCGGRVVTIGLRTTRVRTPDNVIVTVPNDTLSTTEIRHPYDGIRYRVEESIWIGYGEDIDTVSAMLSEVATADERVLSKPAPTTDVQQLGESAIQLVVRFWVRDPADTDIQGTRTDFASRATDRLLAEGVAVAPATAQQLSGSIAVTESTP